MKLTTHIILVLSALLLSQASFASNEIQIAKSDLKDMDCILLEVALDEASFIAEDAQLIEGEKSSEIYAEESAKVKIYAEEMQKRSCSKEFAERYKEKVESKTSANPA